MLIQTQTWRGEDYCRLLEYLLRKLFKEGIIQNIQQYLSALCKRLTSALLFVALCVSPLCLPRSRSAHWGGSEQGFVKDTYQLAFPNTKAKQRWGCQRARVKQVLSGAEGHRQGLIAGTDVFVSFHGCVVNDEWFPLCLKACCHILVNEAASYSLVGVMGLAWLQPHGKQQRATDGDKGAVAMKTGLTWHSQTCQQQSARLYAAFVFNQWRTNWKWFPQLEQLLFNNSEDIIIYL